jgi:undecaprenyl-diphosphatase
MTITSANPVLSVFGYINERDQALMHRIHHWQAPDWIRLVMLYATRAGDGWLWYVLGISLLTFGDESRFAAVMSGTASCGAGLGLYSLLKNATRRKRPCLVEPNPWAHILPPDQYSFPSGHTIAAFSIATSVGLSYPLLMPVLLWCGFLIATSRIMLGMHFLSDVVVGALIGTSLGYVAFLFV